MENTLIVGVSGRMGAGKDAFGGFLRELAESNEFNVVRRGFGDALKEEVADFLVRYTYSEVLDFLDRFCDDSNLVDQILAQTYALEPTNAWERILHAMGIRTLSRYTDYDDLVSQMHDRARKERFRLLMQWWGTEYRRDQFDKDYWLKRVEDTFYNVRAEMEDVEDTRPLLFIITDVRFLNEVKFVQETLEGYAVRILRPNHHVIGGHSSEVELDKYANWNAVVTNDKGLKELRSAAQTVLAHALSWATTPDSYGSTPLR